MDIWRRLTVFGVKTGETLVPVKVRLVKKFGDDGAMDKWQRLSASAVKADRLLLPVKVRLAK
jgi:hypothetical protein